MTKNALPRLLRARLAAAGAAVLAVGLVAAVLSEVGGAPAGDSPSDRAGSAAVVTDPVTGEVTDSATDGATDGVGPTEAASPRTEPARPGAKPTRSPAAGPKGAAQRPGQPRTTRTEDPDPAQRRRSRLAREVEQLTGSGAVPAPLPIPLPAPVPAPLPAAARFRVANLNVLGASHTSENGNRPGWASGNTRMRWTVRLLGDAGVDVVGLQEFELVQYRAFKRLTGDRYGVFPGPALGRNVVRNSIAWRQDTWRLVSSHTVEIPYFYGNRVRMPYVRLEHRASGVEVYFINVHNPASVKSRGPHEKWRDLGTEIEIALVDRLHERGLPVVLTGDFNEREEVFCKMTARTDLRAANGGSAGGGRCEPPPAVGIDWIFGSDSITFSDFARLDGGLVARTTDHPLIVATAEVAAGGQP